MKLRAGLTSKFRILIVLICIGVPAACASIPGTIEYCIARERCELKRQEGMLLIALMLKDKSPAEIEEFQKSDAYLALLLSVQQAHAQCENDCSHSACLYGFVSILP